METDRTDGASAGDRGRSRRHRSSADLLLDLAAIGAFLASASAMVLTKQVSIALLVAVLVGFGIYAAKFVPGVGYDGPSAPTLGLFFVVVGVLLLG